METLLGNAAAAGLFLVAVGVLHLLASIPYRRPQWDEEMTHDTTMVDLVDNG